MAASAHRLDRWIAKSLTIGRSDTRLMLAQRRIKIDGVLAHSVHQKVDHFSHIEVDGKTLQKNTAHYVVLNKPKGVVSATKDDKNKTVIDLLDFPYKQQLHIVGRLDFNSTGLLLLSNDSRWSEKLMLPGKKVAKHYRVSVSKKIDESYIEAFAKGIYFAFEDITTQAATLNILSDFEAEIILTEGKYHQIKRMFAHFDNKVLSLHRTQVGRLILDPQLQAGESRELSAKEVADIF